MLQPNFRKFRKAFKGRINKGYHFGGLSFGYYGLRTIEGGRLSARQIEAARRALRRNLDREGIIWTRQFPDIPVTGKPSEVRRGKGKGAVSYWATRIRPGHIIFEVRGVSKDTAIKSLFSASKKLPRKCRIIKRSTFN